VFVKRGGQRIFLPAASSGDAAPEGVAAGEETSGAGSGVPIVVDDRAAAAAE
jgi:hypothetical protein